MTAQLRTISPADLPAMARNAVDMKTMQLAQNIVDNVEARGEPALRQYAEKFGDIAPGAPMAMGREALRNAFESLPAADRELLQRTANRIRRFAEAQRAALRDVTIDIPGGQAGHTVEPMEVAGCYAPGGRFPLPSSVLMTVVAARAAGVRTVVVASPRPVPITLAAAHVAGADLLLAVGGAHAVAAFAYGIEGLVPRCDVVVGPGSPWVTAAKKIVSGSVAIDMLAGPSELIVYADDTASPAMVAADLLAQAEHAPDSLPVLVTTSEELIDRTNLELARQLDVLPTRATAEESIENGFAVLAESESEALEVVDRLAPEHLELLCADAEAIAKKVKNYGGLFVGANAAEVLGDYGAGPNHTLPTGGTARFTGGLSVMHFLRIRTWMRIDDLGAASDLVQDAVALARHEGLEGHARSAELRRR